MSTQFADTPAVSGELRPQTPVALRVARLGKAYGTTTAISDITFDVHVGEIFGVLGPNGAGKTTLIEILEGVRRADTGRALLLDHDVSDRAAMRRLRARMGIAMQKTILPPTLTVRELLELYATLYVGSAEPEALMTALGLDEKRDVAIRHLSGGQQQRVAVALALVGNPDFIFLDEPSSQLDPQSRRAVWDIFLDQQKRDRTLLLTTHQMEEAERLCTRVAILDHGEILALGSPSALIDRYCPGHVVRFTTSAHADLSFLGTAVSAEPADPSTVTITIRTERLEPVVERLMAARLQGRIVVEGLRTERQTLEDVFLHLTGRVVRN
jgi:ABC-2 type transport system ATP-binding protein